MSNAAAAVVEATPDFSVALFSVNHWMVIGATVMLVGMAVGLHYEALERLNARLPLWGLRARPRVLMLIISLLFIHTAEIWIFGGGIYLLVQHPGLGSVSGVPGVQLLDTVYLSAVTFTTVGYGDLAPHGPLRFLLGSEALTGTVLVTWSASFTFLEMQRFWRH
ncbi:MAG TPA: potassium channel family protein [Nevskiaceae bacterium]|nr:potassium channel family protein [Nevskiaceae bacterium]